MKIPTYLVFLGLGFMPLCAHAAPVGMAANIKGNVTVTDDGKKTPLKLLGRIEPGSTISCGPDSSAVIVLFKNGSRFQIGANQNAKVSATAIDGAQKMAAMSGPSTEAVQLLGGSRVGAVSAREGASFSRLTNNAPAYFEGPTPRFDWIPQPGAAKYSFTLFDDHDNVVWSTFTTVPNATYPLDAPPLNEKQPYVWKMSAFKDSGKPLINSSWGIITLLSREDARELETIATKLREDAKTATDDTPLLLLVETYCYYGVYNSALEILTDVPLVGKPGIKDATNAIYDSMSPIARALAKRPIVADHTP